MPCPPEWKHCIDVGEWDDPMHKMFNGVSKSFNEYMGTTKRITGSGKQIVIREHQLLRQGIPEHDVHVILNKEFKNAKSVVNREHHLMDKGIPELKVHQMLFTEFK